MDFKEVMRQKNRMCRLYYGHCSSCPINVFNTCAHPEDDVLTAYEAVIMDWARKNPEPKYPTWIDWQQKTFPNAMTMICPKQFMNDDELNCDNMCCHDCVNQPIPAGIAKLLGLKKG